MPASSKQKRRIRRKAKSAARKTQRNADVALAASLGLSLAEYRGIVASAKETVTFDVEADLFANADISDSGEEFTPVPYDGEAYNGGDIRQPNVRFPIVVNCATATVAKPTQVLLKDHKSDRPLGQHKAVITATSMRLEDGSISVPNPYSKEVITGARNKFPWQASIRGRWGKLTLLKAGQSRRINGRTIEGPRFIADGFVWRETTVTGLGADQEGPELQIAASDGDITMNFDQWLEKMGLKKDTMSADEIQAAQTTYDAWATSNEIAAADDEDADEDDDDEDDDLEAADEDDDEELVAAATKLKGKKKSRKRKKKSLDLDFDPEEIRAAAAAEIKQGYMSAWKQAAAIDDVFGNDSCYDELRASAMEEDWSKKQMSDARKLYDYENGVPALRPGSRNDNGPADAEVMCAAMTIGAGTIKPEQLESDFGVSADVLDKAASKDYRNIGFHGIIRAAAAEAGIPVPYHIAQDEYPRLAYKIQKKYQFMVDSGEIQAAQAWSTLNLASINENVLNRTIHGRFMRWESIVPKVCQEAAARDFRPHKAYRLWGQGFFEKLSATQEIEHMTFADTAFENAVDTEALMITIPRKAIANDELGIFQQVGNGLADSAFRTRERNLARVLLDPNIWRIAEVAAPGGAGKLPINSLAAGAASELGVDALAQLTDILKDQKDRGGNPIMVNDGYVLLTQTGAQERIARTIHESENLMDNQTGTGAKKNTPKKNPVHGEFPEERRCATPWLRHESVTTKDGSITASPTAYFLFANPVLQPMFQVLYLNDRRTPFVETDDAAFNVLGQQMRSYWDYGMAQIDDIGAAYSPGA